MKTATRFPVLVTFRKDTPGYPVLCVCMTWDWLSVGTTFGLN